MSNDVQHDQNDLFDSEGIAENDLSIDGSSMNNESDDQLDLPPSEAFKKKTVDDWVKKIKDNPDLLDDLKGKQAWLVPLVEKELSAKKDTVSKDDMIEAAKQAAREMIEAERIANATITSEKEYEDLRGKINALYLTPDQRDSLKEEFTNLIAEGLDKTKALKLAAKITNIDFEDTARFRKNLSLPKAGDGSVKMKEVDLGEYDSNSLTSEERYALLKARK